MQTVLHVYCRAGTSLRDKIAKDARSLVEFELYVESQKTQSRSRGWTKIKSNDRTRSGAINLEWDQDTKVLICRVVTRGSDMPTPLVGDLLNYLMARHYKRIRTLVLVPEAGK